MSDAFKKHFIDEMNRLAVVFPGINNKERLSRYFRHVEGLPEAAFTGIVNNLLDHSRQMPLPKDFEVLAKDWRNAFYSRNGYYYGTEKLVSQEACVDCDTCFDSGIIKVTRIEDDKFMQLMRCTCQKGKESQAIIPVWEDIVHQQSFKKMPLNDRWFNPTFAKKDSDETMGSKLMKKLAEWKSQIVRSENYWREQGYKRSS